jgi:hypothetical protein
MDQREATSETAIRVHGVRYQVKDVARAVAYWVETGRPDLYRL